ncbi:T6SS immunity protein Tli4 family protein [Frateuria sp. Soil773]|uniref:T6SS immunity protein Tli4 family protein n=1 Tax=Frateuria sp. Soil773 TaxID=1736407 RepID=UPI0012F8C923|nr:T6SS immunity protein Tli4 family protein [Frateuria sp. Soil773]
MTSNDGPTDRTVHIGRFSMKVPRKALIRIDTKYQGIQVADQGTVTSFEALKQRLQTQSQKYTASKAPFDPEDDAILRAGGADPAMERTESQLIGFDVHAESNEVIIAYLPDTRSFAGNIELHKWVDGHDVVLSRNRIGASDYAVQRADLLAIAKHFKSLASLTRAKHIPPGFIVENGIFVDEGSPEPRGNVTLVVTDPQHPGMSLTFIASDIEKHSSEPPLSSSVDDELDRLRNLTHDLKVIHRGDRVAAGQSGYLIAISGSDPDNPGPMTYKYLWEAPGVPNDVKRPAMSVELNTDAENHNHSSFKSTQEATEYFDRFLNSIRFRSGDK